MEKVQLPSALQKKFRLIGDVQNDAFFAHLGHVKFNELTEYQANWLIDNKSPLIERVEESKETKTITPKIDK